MHYAGVACDMEKVLEIARKNNILVIEDITLSAPPYLSSQSTAIAFFILLFFLNYPLTK